MFIRQAKLMLGAILTAFIFLGGAYWYFNIYTKTVDYTLNAISNAIENKDAAQFNRYVDIESVLEDVFPSFVDEMMRVELGVAKENDAVFNELSEFFKPTFIRELHSMIDMYITVGNWGFLASTDSQESIINPSRLVERLGLDNITAINVTGIDKGDSDNNAQVWIKLIHGELDNDVQLELELVRNSDTGEWQVAHVHNVYDYMKALTIVRQEKLRQYIKTTDEIIARHKTNIEEIDLKLHSIMAGGSLGKNSTREELKNIVENEVEKDWKIRKSELMAVPTPLAVLALHNLRLKICDLHIEYIRGYSAWMTDKNAATIKQAEEKLRQAMILEQEEKLLLDKLSHVRAVSE